MVGDQGRPLDFEGPVTLIGGGPLPEERLDAVLAIAPVIVAADGGADHPLPPGNRLAAVIGDMDSQRHAAAHAARGAMLRPIAEQDTTDLEKCLYSVTAPLYLGLGFLGGRIDHHMAAMNALAKFPRKHVVLIGQDDLCFLCPPSLELDLEAGTRVSLFPMAPVTGTVSEGLDWSVKGLAMRPDGRIGTSNRASGGPVRLGFDAPAVLVMLPQALLSDVVAALRPLP